MMTIHLDKVVTIMKELGTQATMIRTLKYKELADVIGSQSEIIADYPFGQRKNRMNHLVKLGFSLKETIWFNDDAPYARIREVWVRG